MDYEYTPTNINDVTSIKTWGQEAPFYERFPHMRIIDRLKHTTDVQGISILPEDTVVQFACDAKLNEKISLWHGDITTLKVDAIVNAFHTALLGSGDVDGLILLKAGDKLLEELLASVELGSGEVRLTTGHKLPAKFIIHTAGPVGLDINILKANYVNSLNLAVQHGIRTIAFPCISTGYDEFPAVEACQIALRSVREWLTTNSDKIDRIIFCVYSLKNEAAYQTLLPSFFPIQ